MNETLIRHDASGCYDYAPKADITGQELAWLVLFFDRSLPLSWLQEKAGKEVMRHFEKRE